MRTNDNISEKIISSTQYANEENYWLNQLSGHLEKSKFPGDFKRTGEYKPGQEYIAFNISNEITAKIIGIGKGSAPKIFMILTAGLMALLDKYSYERHKDIIIGAPIYKQKTETGTGTEGEFINTVLALKTRVDEHISFKELLRQVRQTIIAANENANYPIETLLYQLNLPFTADDFPLFDVAILLENIHERNYLKNIHLNMIFSFFQTGDSIQGTVEYNGLYYEKEYVTRIIRHFISLLKEGIAKIDGPLNRICILSGEEKEQLLYAFNNRTRLDSARSGAEGKTIHGFFEAAVERDEGRIASIHDDMHLSYNKLEEKANRLAHVLRAKGVKTDVLVGMMVERSIEMITGMLGILKAGGAYLPIDPGYPQERIEYIIDDSGVTLLLTGANRARDLNFKVELSCLEMEAHQMGKISKKVGYYNARGSAYVIYTSGSTGRPKGVVVEHRSIANTLCWRKNYYKFDHQVTSLQIPSYSFDSSVEDIFTPLISGSKLVLLRSEDPYEMQYIGKIIMKYLVTHILIVPNFYKIFTREIGESLKHLKKVTVAGESFTEELVKVHFDKLNNVELYNEYGPTENSVCTTVYRFTPNRTPVLIGKPVDNVNCYILDLGQELVPIGVPGQLFVSGAGIARGYLNNPGLTYEKFKIINYKLKIKNGSGALRADLNAFGERKAHELHELPRINEKFLRGGPGGAVFSKSAPPGRRRQKLYLTGDLARWLFNGNIEFLGRVDHQVKIRGNRIELGEIESYLMKYPGIREVVAVVREDVSEDKYICAYFVADDEYGKSEIRDYLSKVLPDYMIPTYYVRLEQIPLTSNGKVDRRALPGPDLKVSHGFTAPADEIEKKLQEIWSEVLEIEKEKISINDNFFHLGGHSLKAAVLVSRIHKELNVNVPLPEIFKTPNIRGLAAFIKNTEKQRFFSIAAVEKKEYYILSSAQKRLYVLQQIDPENTGYNVPAVMTLKGEVNGKKFAGIFRKLIGRHDSFRTSFRVTGEEPVQQVHEETVIDHWSLIIGEAEKNGAEDIIKNFIKPFDLSRAPLLRVGLIKVNEKNHILVVDMPHIISDGASSDILVREFMLLYEEKTLLPARIQYKDFSIWQDSKQQKEMIKQQEVYWLKQFRGDVPVLNLPTDYPRPSVQDLEGRTLHFEMDDEVNLALKQIARAEGATFFMILLACYSIFLSKICSQEDLIIGTPIASRNHIDLENIIGMFVNFLALRIFPTAEKSFIRVLKEVKEQSARAFENQDYPFEELVKQIEGDRDGSRNPIFDVMLTHQAPISIDLEIPGLILKPYRHESRVSKLDLSLQFTENQSKVFYRFEYSTKLFRVETMENFVRYFKTMVLSILKNPGLQLFEIEILPSAVKKYLLMDLNETRRDYPRDKTVNGLFEEQVDRTPYNTAVRSTIQLQNIYDQLKPEDVEVEISYEELDKRANQLAHKLKELGVGPDCITGLTVQHPLEKAIGIWGILKAGAAYLPIDPTYPPAVIKDILSDSQVRWLVSEPALTGLLTDLKISGHIYVLFSDEIESHYSPLNPLSTPSTNDLAYIIYTSGTTGKPKGTAVKHKGIVNYAWWRIHYFQFTGKDVTLQPLTYSFDSFCGNFYPTMLSGGELVMVPDNRRLDFDYIAGLMGEYRVTIVCMTPSLYNTLLETAAVEDLQGLRLVVLAGEPTSPALLKKSQGKLPQTQIANEYGPTEGTVAAACNPEIKENAVNMIGTPIANAKIYILNDSLQPAIPGAVGEICIAGTGVTRGYLNRPQLTHEKFLIINDKLKIKNGSGALRAGSLNAFGVGTSSKKVPGKRIYPNMSYMSHMSYIYRTGDLGRWQRNEQGNWELEFLGRKDHQVKIRGHRIEMEQVETLLVKHHKIKEAVVDIRGKQDNKYMCAYVVPGKVKDFQTAEINNYLQERLPYYMVPSRILPVEKLPLTPNGKVDRSALPDPDFTPKGEYAAPGNSVEESLARLWAEVLNIREEMIGIDTNFFDLGGHSLRATMLLSKLEKKLDVKIPMGHFFNAPTIQELSGLIDRARRTNEKEIAPQGRGGFKPIVPVEKKDYYPVSSQQKRLYTLRQFAGEGTAYNVFTPHWLKGNVDVEQIERSFHKLIEKHEAFRTGFEILEGNPVQRIQDQVDFKLKYEELNHREMAASCAKKFKREFDLRYPPLLSIMVLKAAGNEYLMLADMHHIIADGASSAILINDLARAYEGEGLEPLKIQYKDYVEWQQELLGESGFRKQEEYWLQRYAGEIPVLNLLTDYPRPAVQSFEGSLCYFQLSQSWASRLKQVCREYDVTLYMLLLACYQVLLSKYSRQDDVVVGSPVAGRDHADKEGIVGMFANTLCIRSQPAGENEFSAYLAEIKKLSIEAYENQDYPFEELLENVEVTRDVSRNPLFDTMFVLQNIDMKPLKMGDTEIMPYKNEPDTAKFDLTFVVSEVEEKITYVIEYCTRLFKEETVNRLGMHYRQILEEVTREPGKKISQIEMVTQKEKEQLVYAFNDTRTEYPGDKTIDRLFQRQVTKTPDHVALVGNKEGGKVRIGKVHLTYRQLNKKSRQLACLLEQKGVRTDTIVGIMGGRSIEMITGILGILNAGGAYLPIDPGYPRERVYYMLKDSDVKVLLKCGNEGPGKPGIPITKSHRNLTNSNDQYPDDHNKIAPCIILNFENLDFEIVSNFEFRASDLNPGNLVYVMYTSGSTGRPKGVMLQHKNLVNLLHFQNNRTFIDSTRISQFTSISFDVSFQEIFSAFLSGGTLFLIPRETGVNVPEFFNFITGNDIKTVYLPMSFLRMIFNEDHLTAAFPGCVTNIITAGEQVIIDNKFGNYLRQNQVVLHNHYGPTESHVVTTFSIDPGGEVPAAPPIGKPVDNCTIYILELDAVRLVPIGIAGEIYIGGVCLSRGYLNHPELTAEKFDQDLAVPFGQIINAFGEEEAHELHELTRIGATSNEKFLQGGPGGAVFSKSAPPGRRRQKIYKTGDLGRWLPDGNIEFIGRIDHQVKVRGFRVELGEIENQLLTHGEVKEAIAITRDDNRNDKYLCAYIVAAAKKTNPVDPFELKEYLANRLPDYMVPSYFVQLDKIPLTPNGKIDRKALPAPVPAVYDYYEAPRNDIEKKLVDIWSGVLGTGKEKISIDANFFHLGGHSLKATVLFSRIHKELNVNIPLTEIFKTPHIRGLAAYIGKAAKSKHISVEPVEKKDYYPLSSAQRRLYILQQMDEQGIGYNIPSLWQVEGNLDEEKFESVFHLLVRRHESLRTSFAVVNGEPVQRIDEKVEIKVKVKKEEQTTEPQAATYLSSGFIRPFDLAEAPLLRVEFIKINDLKHVLMVDMHHIISDGVSINIFIKEFIDLYAGKRPPVLRLQYKDYSGWQSRQVQGERIKQQETYWKKEFSGQVPVLDLPTDFTRPTMQSFVGGSIRFETGKKETAALKSLAREQNVTLFMLLLSIYNIFLNKLSSQEDIVVGTPIAGRRHIDIESIIGMFVNTLALRNFPRAPIAFTTFLQEVKERTIKAFDHQDHLYEELVEQVEVERDTGRNPLFDTMFALQNADNRAIEIPGLNVMPYPDESLISKFDLTLTAVERQENLFFFFEYCTKLFKKETIQRFIVYFNRVISGIVENEAIKLSGIEIIDEKEKNQVLYELNDTATDYPKEKTIRQLFAEQVEQTPDHTALVGPKEEAGNPGTREARKKEDIYITYKELNHKSGQMAYLLKEKGVLPGSIVGIMLERSLELIIGIWGILKAGGAYLPIDPGYPPGRISYMLKDSSAGVLVTGHELSKRIIGSDRLPITNCQLLIVNENSLPPLHRQPAPAAAVSSSSTLTCRASPANPAYVIYTSGSTGKPKGVMIGHKAVNNFITGITGQIPFKPGKVLLAVTTICFDIHVLEILLPLCRGVRVVAADEQQQRDGNLLTAAILKHHIDMLQVTPSRLRMLPGIGHGQDTACLKHLKEIMVGGEPFPGELLEKLKQLTPARIYNMYGPTETTVWSTVEDLTHIRKITIGRPIANTRVYILDKKQNLQPVGIAGELSIGGDGIAAGYINQPGLTREKFYQDLWDCRDYRDEKQKDQGKRIHTSYIYRTGDIARWLIDGRIEFFGRIDNQVKIRGFRIELGEIESQLLTHEKIKQAVVISREDSTGNKYLCAYIVLTPGEINTNDEVEFREYLTGRLPGYMVPSFFVQLDKIPLTPNGKTDRKVLPAPGIKAGDNYEAPGSELEKRLVEIWQEVLGVEQVGIDDNFFHLGGHSLKAIQIVFLFEKEGIRMNVGDLFRYGNIKTLVQIKSVPRELSRENEIIGQTVEKEERCPGEERENILKMLEKSIREFSHAILEGKVIKRYPLSAMQRAYLKLSRRSAGTLLAFNGYPDQDRLSEAIIKTTSGQGLLRSRMKKENSELLWYEHEMPGNLPVPFVDLTHYRSEEAEKITRVIAARYFRSSEIDVTVLPYIVILIKKSVRDHLVVFAADHTIYDALTGQVLKTNLENFYHYGEAPEKREKPAIKGYDEYVNQINKGPQQVNQDKIIRTFELEEFSGSMAEVNRVFKANRSNRYVNREITIPLKDIGGHSESKKPLEISLRIYVSLCKMLFGVENIPLLFFTFGRKYQDKEFFDTMGEFTDLVPILVKSNENILAGIEEKIAFAAKYNINFMTTIMNGKIPPKWKKVIGLLSPGGIGYEYNLLRFNFTGKTVDIELDREKEHNHKMEIREHPPIDKVELDGVTVMASYNNERLKIEVGFNMKMDQAEFRERIREITRQIEDFKDLDLA